MSSLQEQLIAKGLVTTEDPQYPKRGEVWYVNDSKIELDQKNRKDKGNRAVIIAHCDESYNPNKGIPVIPLSNSGDFSMDCVPICEDYSQLNDNFTPTPNSMSIIPHHQYIPFRYFDSHCGLLGSAVMCAILYSLCDKFIEFDLT